MLDRNRLMRRCAQALLATAACVAASSGHADGKPSLEAVAFLAGCWEGDLGDGAKIRETYTAPRGGLMLGNSQVSAGTKTQFFEFIQLKQTDAGVVYQPSPNAKDAAAFPLVKVAADEAVFENPQNDFPQRITYRYDGKTLTARIEMMDGSKAETFVMKATACGK